MSLKSPIKSKSHIPLIPGGTYAGICVGVIDVGEQFDKYPGEKEGAYKNQIVLIFEIVGEHITVDGVEKPRWYSETYTNSTGKRAKLRDHLQSWRGHDITDEEIAQDYIDLSQLTGRPCLLAISVVKKEDGEEKNKLNGITGLPAGYPAPKPESEILVFDIDDRDEAVFEKLPGWIQEKIKKSTQYRQDLPDEPLENPAAGQAPTPTECPI